MRLAAYLGLNGIGGEENRGLWRAVDLLVKDCFLHLQVEEMLRHLLDQLLPYVLRKELGLELEGDGLHLGRMLICYLHNGHTVSIWFTDNSMTHFTNS